ncbi:hypothetical protein Peur_041577 [Populus x canadensis]
MAINKQFLVLHPSWIQRIQEGFRFNLIFFGTVLVSSPPTQALEVSVSSNRSLSPTPKDSSGAGIVSPSSLVNDCLDGSGGDSFEGEEFISGVAFKTFATSTDAINGVFNLLAGVHGPEGFCPLSIMRPLPSCSSDFVDLGASHLWLLDGRSSLALELLCCLTWLVLFWMLLLSSLGYVSGSPFC